MLAQKLGKVLTEAELDAMMAEIDTDGGGDVDFDEFHGWWSRPDDGRDRCENGVRLSVVHPLSHTTFGWH
jgi:Ca2+-binding EF-hand superfamily protein